MDVKVAANGRLILPRAARQAMGVSGDTKLHLEIEGNVVRLEPLSRRVHRAQELYRQAVRNPRTVDDFLRDRREEADADERESAAARTADRQEAGASSGERTGGETDETSDEKPNEVQPT